ncbi:hypothetical protein COCMIDRAFT_35656 [Bipolaris oryzae ATCC 44560]|uniref:Uncharacterized protein n=1 Tax=Bipolaris oryzae ATCC 44560 TaxID=930090 RepID=W6ZSY3_COCMI|nr:uncharacterized protein COCMIDRAFT_35656 [Bipolaris oryzae ATCC 44560]EUC46791.1 hypothetical protein COCMIDRAFT_35656 [Bipolaris oryzae ATCC 44560]
MRQQLSPLNDGMDTCVSLFAHTYIYMEIREVGGGGMAGLTVVARLGLGLELVGYRTTALEMFRSPALSATQSLPALAPHRPTHVTYYHHIHALSGMHFCNRHPHTSLTIQPCQALPSALLRLACCHLLQQMADVIGFGLVFY